MCLTKQTYCGGISTGSCADEWMGNEKWQHTEATGFKYNCCCQKTERNNIMGNGFATVSAWWNDFCLTADTNEFHQLSSNHGPSGLRRYSGPKSVPPPLLRICLGV